jgi:hypothetical protein
MVTTPQRKRVLIVNCFLDETRRLVGRPHFVPQAIGPAYLAGAFNRELVDIRLYNELSSGPFLNEKLVEWAQMVVLTGMTSGYDRMRHISAYVRTKSAKTIIVAGGPGIRALPKHSKQFFDYSCTGDIEVLMDVVRECFGDDYVAAHMTPRFDLVNWTGHLGYIESSRNCNFKCSFCCLTGEGNSYQTYDIDYVREQLDSVGRKLSIVFVDNNFYGNNRAFFRAKMDLLKEYWKKGAFFGWAALVTNDFFANAENIRLAKESGCVSLFTGLESFDSKVLKSFNKMQNVHVPQVEMIRSCLDAGIIFNYGVIFDPSSRPLAEIRDEIRFIVNTPEITLPVFMNLTVPMLRTPYFYDCVKDRRILPKAKLRDMDGDTLTLRPLDPVEDVVQFLRDMPTLRGFKKQVLRHVVGFAKRYYRKMNPLLMGVALGNAGFICFPGLIHNHTGFLKRTWTLKTPPRTYVTTDEPVGPLYEPLLPVADKYRHYLEPTMVTDENGDIAEEIAEDMGLASPSVPNELALAAAGGMVTV